MDAPVFVPASQDAWADEPAFAPPLQHASTDAPDDLPEPLDDPLAELDAHVAATLLRLERWLSAIQEARHA